MRAAIPRHDDEVSAVTCPVPAFGHWSGPFDQPAADGSVPAVAGLRPDLETHGRPWPVRLIFSVGRTLPYVADGMVGCGMYAFNESGRARPEDFLALTGHYVYVQRLFRPEEVWPVADHSFPVAIPRTMASPIRVRTRLAAGDAELVATGQEDFESTRVSRLRRRSTPGCGRAAKQPPANELLLLGTLSS